MDAIILYSLLGLLIWVCLLTTSVLATACVLSYFLYRSRRAITQAMAESQKGLLAALVARQIKDPRVSAAAVQHLLKERPPMPVQQPEPPEDDNELRPGSVAVMGNLG